MIPPDCRMVCVRYDWFRLVRGQRILGSGSTPREAAEDAQRELARRQQVLEEIDELIQPDIRIVQDGRSHCYRGANFYKGR